jgi:hypothetical protein
MPLLETPEPPVQDKRFGSSATTWQSCAELVMRWRSCRVTAAILDLLILNVASRDVINKLRDKYVNDRLRPPISF